MVSGVASEWHATVAARVGLFDTSFNAAAFRNSTGSPQKSPHGVVKGAYEKLRGTAKKNVEAAVPRLGRLIEKHAG